MKTANEQNHALTSGCCWSFITPSIDSYEQQKKVRVVGSQARRNPVQSNWARAIGFSENATSDLSRTQKWHIYYKIRIESALNQDFSAKEKSVSFFPGHTIPGPGGSNCHEVYRGSLMFEQFLNLNRFKATAGTLNPPCTAAPSYQFWPWPQIKQPELFFVDMKTIGQESLDKPNHLNIDQHLLDLKAACQQLLNENAFAQVLSTIRQAWDRSEKETNYDIEALAAAQRIFNSYKERINNDNLLPVLFELEALTSYATYHQDSAIFATGVFSSNWVEAALRPLGSIKATEFCVRERLLDEVINLTSKRFAPIVVNEFGSVSDGNHRLTSCWIWNLLKFTSDCQWSLEDEHFQQKVTRFIDEFADELGPISTHEVLGHLAFFLSNPESRSRLNNQVRRLTERHGFIFEVPVVLLPEYSSSTVIKDLYDDGRATVRVAPSIYQAMSAKRSLVLPPRASYHFTDSALLPWFSVLTSATNTHKISEQINSTRT
ncbi:MAG: hypothetical protein K2W82_11540 [Candidatus Obscuribacterales bacterium]|nr:hypothetical protein [Candidatus Obscuribacterales bacterium]